MFPQNGTEFHAAAATVRRDHCGPLERSSAMGLLDFFRGIKAGR
ncbi:hypothetical protein [Salinifilum aidingensis]